MSDMHDFNHGGNSAQEKPDDPIAAALEALERLKRRREGVRKAEAELRLAEEELLEACGWVMERSDGRNSTWRNDATGDDAAVSHEAALSRTTSALGIVRRIREPR